MFHNVPIRGNIEKTIDLLRKVKDTDQFNSELNSELKHNLDYSIMLLTDSLLECPLYTEEQLKVLSDFQIWVFDNWDDHVDNENKWKTIFRSQRLHDLYDCLLRTDVGEPMPIHSYVPHPYTERTTVSESFNKIVVSRLGLKPLVLPKAWKGLHITSESGRGPPLNLFPTNANVTTFEFS